MDAKRVLIIDDDAELCQELAELLNGEGYATAYTTDAGEGEALLRTGAYDTILLDCRMPRLGGLHILRNIESEDIARRILVITGYPCVENLLREGGLMEKIGGVIAKPINPVSLLDRIREQAA